MTRFLRFHSSNSQILAHFSQKTFCELHSSWQKVKNRVLLLISTILRGIQMRQQMDNEWVLFIGGILAILYGVFVLFNPFPSIYILVIALGAISIIGGLLLIPFAFRLRKMGRDLEAL